jgi:hypothetical protein
MSEADSNEQMNQFNAQITRSHKLSSVMPSRAQQLGLIILLGVLIVYVIARVGY